MRPLVLTRTRSACVAVIRQSVDSYGHSWVQLPQPKDSRLSLEVAGGEVAAVLKFEGTATREATLQAVAQLKTIIASGAMICNWPLYLHACSLVVVWLAFFQSIGVIQLNLLHAGELVVTVCCNALQACSSMHAIHHHHAYCLF